MPEILNHQPLAPQAKKGYARIRREPHAHSLVVQNDSEMRVNRSGAMKAGRMTCNMLIAAAGANGRTAMEFMRHHDPKMTFDNYNASAKLPKWQVVNALPALLRKNDNDTVAPEHTSY